MMMNTKLSLEELRSHADGELPAEVLAEYPVAQTTNIHETVRYSARTMPSNGIQRIHEIFFLSIVFIISACFLGWLLTDIQINMRGSLLILATVIGSFGFFWVMFTAISRSTK